jgi:hypothetical protein
MSDDEPKKEYEGVIWIGDEPGIRFTIRADSGRDARELLEKTYGTGHVITLHNKEDAERLR